MRLTFGEVPALSMAHRAENGIFSRDLAGYRTAAGKKETHAAHALGEHAGGLEANEVMSSWSTCPPAQLHMTDLVDEGGISA